MAKKVALLFSLVMIFSLSFVFATEENQDILLIAPAPSDEIVETVSGDLTISGEIENISGEVVNNISGEAISGETLTEDVASGEVTAENISGETISDTNKEDSAVNTETNIPTTENTEHNHDEDTKNSTVFGAVIAIVIVVAVVAVVAVIQKK